MSCFSFQSKTIFFWFRVIARGYCGTNCKTVVFLVSVSSFPNVGYGTVFLMALPSSLGVFFPALVSSFGVTVTDEFAFCLV